MTNIFKKDEMSLLKEKLTREVESQKIIKWKLEGRNMIKVKNSINEFKSNQTQQKAGLNNRSVEDI